MRKQKERDGVIYRAIAANNYHTLFKVRQNVRGIKAAENCDMCVRWLEGFAWILVEKRIILHDNRQASFAAVKALFCYTEKIY